MNFDEWITQDPYSSDREVAEEAWSQVDAMKPHEVKERLEELGQETSFMRNEHAREILAGIIIDELLNGEGTHT